VLPEASDDLLKLATGEKAFRAVVLMTRDVFGSGVWYLRLGFRRGVTAAA